jgi:hypothetical protein
VSARRGSPGGWRRHATSAAPRFYGDPGPGNYYMGMTPDVSSLATHEAKMGGAPLAMVRIFSGSNTPPWAAADTAIAGGRIPWISWKEGTFTNADIGAGLHDDWIHTISDQFKARAPQAIFWTFHHEPENDAITQGTANMASYRAAQRRIKTVMRADGVTNDVFCAVLYMTPFTFQASSGRDWRTWYPDWRNVTGLGSAAAPDPNDFWKHGDPNSVVDVFGIDFYHEWQLDKLPGNPISIFSTLNVASTVWFRDVKPKVGFLGQSYAIGEWSTAAAQDGPKDPNGDGSWTLAEYATSLAAGLVTYFPNQTDAYIDDYFTTMVPEGAVAFCWWDGARNGTGNVENSVLSVADPNETRWKRLGIWASKPQAKTDPT